MVSDGGSNALVVSSAPLSVPGAGGAQLPVDLELQPAGGGFESKRPATTVRYAAKEPAAALTKEGVGV